MSAKTTPPSPPLSLSPDVGSIDKLSDVYPAGTEAVHTHTYLGCDQWYYQDEDDVVQGPFHANHMLAWMKDG